MKSHVAIEKENFIQARLFIEIPVQIDDKMTKGQITTALDCYNLED